MGRLIATAWVMAEVLAYAAFLSYFSLLAGLLVGVASTGLGLVTLRLVGQRLTREATANFMRRASMKDIEALPLALLGAILLLLPGFLTDLAGLGLVLIGARSLLRPIAAARPDSRHIDLARDEWTRLPDDDPPR